MWRNAQIMEWRRVERIRAIQLMREVNEEWRERNPTLVILVKVK